MKKIVLILSIACLTVIGMAQNSQWEYYSRGEIITSITEEGDYFWIWTNGGLVHLHKTSGEKTCYNTANSELRYNNLFLLIDKFGNKWIDYESSYGYSYNAVFAFDEPNVIVYDSTNSPFPTSSGSIAKPFICVDGYAWVEAAAMLTDTTNRYFYLRFDGTAWVEDTATSIEFTGIKDTSGNIW